MTSYRNLLSVIAFIYTLSMPFYASAAEVIGYVKTVVGQWKDAKHENIALSQFSNVYANSQIQRVNEPNNKQRFVVVAYECKQPITFDCSKPKTCQGHLDLTHKLKECRSDKGLVNQFNEIIAAFKNPSGSLRSELMSRGSASDDDKVQDAVISINDNRIAIDQALADLKIGSYSLSYQLLTDNNELKYQEVELPGKAVVQDIEPGIYNLEVSKKGEKDSIDSDTVILAVPENQYKEVFDFLDKGKKYLDTLLGSNNNAEKKTLLRYLLLSKDPRKVQ